MEKIKKLCSLMLATLMCLSVVGCNKDNSNTESTVSSVENSDSVIETTVQQVEDDVNPEDNIVKMVNYIESAVDISEFTLDESDNLAYKKTYRFNNFENADSRMGNIIQLEDGTIVELFVTTINNLVANGYTVKKVGGDGEDSYRLPVLLEKGDKKIYVFVSDDETNVYSAVIRSIDLSTDEKYIDFDFYGATKDSNFYSILSLFGSPTNSISVECDENGENCTILLGYYSSEYDIYTYVHFNYDSKTDQTTLTEIYIST